jgi:hypothetical protein
MNANVIRTGGVHVFISREFRKNLHSLSRLFAARTDRQFQFDKRSQLLIRARNETVSVAVKFLLASRRTSRYTNFDDSVFIGRFRKFVPRWEMHSVE